MQVRVSAVEARMHGNESSGRYLGTGNVSQAIMAADINQAQAIYHR